MYITWFNSNKPFVKQIVKVASEGGVVLSKVGGARESENRGGYSARSNTYIATSTNNIIILILVCVWGLPNIRYKNHALETQVHVYCCGLLHVYTCTN